MDEIRQERADLARSKGQIPLDGTAEKSRKSARTSMALLLLAYACFIWGAISYNMDWPSWVYVPLFAVAASLMFGAFVTDPN